jgi:hypothetical protein
MSSIYKNAYVTISAAKATKCEDGFLEHRSTVGDLLKSSFKLEILTPKDPVALNEWIERYRTKRDFSNFMSGDDLEAILQTSSWNHADAWYDTPSTVWLASTPLGDGDKRDLLTAGDIKDEPITARGWTLQESWLSPRMLIYGSAQLLWKCSTGVLVDGGVPGSNSSRELKNSYRTDEKGDMVWDDGTRVTDSGKELIFGRMWRDIVRESSRRVLKYPEDKLNALEGIVQEFRRQTGDEYLAGLWKSRLVGDLSWYQNPTHKGEEFIKLNTERDCPSWSWIKTDGPVSHSYAENSRVVVKHAQVDIEIVPEGTKRRLVVEGGITLLAPMSTLPIMQALPNFKFLTKGCSRLAFTNVIFPDGAATNPEFSVEETNGDVLIGAPPDMSFLELSWGKQDGNQNIANESRGLVLVPLDVEGRNDVFRRVGFYIVALEEDLERKQGNLVSMLSFGSEGGNVTPTEFGKLWKASLKRESVIIF